MLEQSDVATQLTRTSAEVGEGSPALVDFAWYTLELESQRLMAKMKRQERALAQRDAAGENNQADQSARTARQSESIAMWRLWERMLHEVERAMARIENGTYGVCEHCGLAIPAERLQALPSAVLCTDCAALQAKNVWAV